MPVGMFSPAMSSSESPVDPMGKRDKIVTADFTAFVYDQFRDAAETWLTGAATAARRASTPLVSE